MTPTSCWTRSLWALLEISRSVYGRNSTRPRHHNTVMPIRRPNFRPRFTNTASIQTSASSPWLSPVDENLCLAAVALTPNPFAIIVMGADRRYYSRVIECVQKGFDPLTLNTAYADEHNYALRWYEDEEVPFLARWGKNAVEGELRKIFELADAMRPGGPRFGRWAGVVRPPPGSGPPKMVMWVDADAHIVTPSIVGNSKSRDRGHNPLLNGTWQSKTAKIVLGIPDANNLTCLPALSLEQVILRTCDRADFPKNFVRAIAQDSGSSVNAGWYVFSAGGWGASFLKYLLELFEVYAACGVWGQNIIQEALLLVMDGSPPPWSLVLPCSGERFKCFQDNEYERLRKLKLIEAAKRQKASQQAATFIDSEAPNRANISTGPGVSNGKNISRYDGNIRAAVVSRAAAANNATKKGLLSKSMGQLNLCFTEWKYLLAPNGEGNWHRSIEAQDISRVKGEWNCGAKNNTSTAKPCCSSIFDFAIPACNANPLRRQARDSRTKKNGDDPLTPFWAASGAGVVLLPEVDPDVAFNSLSRATNLLFHHGHGR
eukprot:CAMPEP_0172624734 /NCGR_PEP_ID=MMETSP1068-20121228/138929_1 /TAXON_ID=35684 /ORGANISM="Pseudopedinella elastica, Strain CCMP716" /LENGTH=543 /DNA_ID=CAMNT_0013433793 /DNA_START=182 /DNA_END=1810 /DNA_ORIENTATION=+